ncbi:MAG: J domain-containing protein, partial [Chloroflexaceae bacterium]|nr:J domain-containing protein [Chloroflexaceae bacterium]
ATAAPGSDVEASLRLTFAEAFHGVQKRFSAGSETVEVRIPPGAKQGSRVRVRGKGQLSPYGGGRGDLYLTIALEPHRFFRFEGDHLVCEVALSPDEAVLGTTIEVPTPDGLVSVKVPPGVRSGQSLRLRGKGWPQPKGGRGDQLVRLSIETPKTLSPTQRELYEKIRANRSFNPRPHLQDIRL